MAVQAVYWVGVCDSCGEQAPEMRDSFTAAQEDAESCPCIGELDD